MRKYYKVLLFLLLLLFPIAVDAATTTLFNASNTKELCTSISNKKVKIGVHSFYSGTDTILENTSGSCSNSAYFTNNLSEKVAGQDYPSWTYFTRASTSYQQFIEDIDASNADEYRYVFIQNKYQSYSTSTGKLLSSSTLKAGESIFIDIDLDTKFNISDYSDLRVSLNYGLTSSDISILRYNCMTFNLLTDNNKKYGPFKLGDVDFVKRYVNKNSSGSQTTSIYKLVSENLKGSSIPANTKIKKVRIVPYENYPVQTGVFRFFNLSLMGYSGSYSNGKTYISVTSAATKTRQNITNNMATNATIKWGVNSNRKLKFYCGLCGGNPKTFESTYTYYGMPYVNNLNATYYSFLSHTTKQNGIPKYNFATKYVTKEISSRGNEMEGTTTDPLYVYETGSGATNETRMQELSEHDYVPNKASNYFLGQDCSSSVFYADGKELPYVDTLALSNAHLGSFHVRLLGGLESNFSEIEKMLRNNNLVASNERITDTKLRQYHTAYIKNKYTVQQIYNGYALLQPGDSLVVDGHVRMETGYTHVECSDGTTTNKYTSNYCSSHGGINGKKSYVITSEVRGAHANLAENKTEVNTHVTQAQAGWTMTPDSSVTDVTDIDSLYEKGNTKIVSFKLNKKYNFETIYRMDDSSTTFDPSAGIELGESTYIYLPYRYKEMDKEISTNKVEKPVVKFILDQQYDATLLNAKLYNYLKKDHKLRGELITNYIIDKIKIKINSNSYYVYPNQTNYYSLYSTLQDETILNALSKLNYGNTNTISVGIMMGPNIDNVKSSLSLDSEGFINVITITTPESKITPTFTVDSSATIENGSNKTLTYTYNGDGAVTCNSSSSAVVTCSVDTSTKKVTLTTKGAGKTTVTLKASAGDIYAALNKTISVTVNEKTYSVSFNANGGKGGQSAVVNVIYGSAMPTISTTKPTKTGYTFKGWYDTSASSGGTQYYNANGASVKNWDKKADTTLYARWSINTYTVTFDSNGGSTIDSQKVQYGKKATKPTNPTKKGYVFEEWQLNGKAYNFSSTISNNITLKAVWTKSTALSGILINQGYSVSGKYVSKFKVGTTITDLKKKLGSDVTVTTSSTTISTGTVIKKGSESYTVFVKGDLDGNGKINSADLLSMRKHLLEEKFLTGAYKEAGIIESDNTIKSLDLLRLKQYLMDQYKL